MPTGPAVEVADQAPSCSAYIESGHYCRSGLRVYGEHEGQPYCVLHYPGLEKKEIFDQLVQTKLDGKDFEFEGAWFPDAPPFSGLRFVNEVNFCDATFAGGVDFSGSTFLGPANFYLTKFRVFATFENANFNKKTNFA